MVRRPLGRTGIELSPIGFGAFKIGRNQGIKYAQRYELPTDEDVERLLGGIIDLGINYIDTAPAYGTSEERLGRMLRKFRRNDLVVSTKVGETFAEGRSIYDFTAESVRLSIARSRERLRMETLDLVFIHSDGNDEEILQNTQCVQTLMQLKKTGDIRAIGFSGKTISGNMLAEQWADAIMVEFDFDDPNARFSPTSGSSEKSGGGGGGERGRVGVVIKKGLGSGRIPPKSAIPQVLRHPGVTSMVIGGLNLDHFRQNVEIAKTVS